MATFTGFEVIRFNDWVYGDLFLGSQSLAVIGDGLTWDGAQRVYLGSGAVTCVGIDVVYSTSTSNWNAGNSIDGGYIYLNTTSSLGSVYYDFTTNTLSNVKVIGSWGAYYDGSGKYFSADLTAKINSAVASGVAEFYSLGPNAKLVTSDASLDLSHSKVAGFTVESTNATGTNFTVSEIGTAFQIAGGSGTDTITAQGFAFSVDQRNSIFAASSIEKIVDQTGTYTLNTAPVITSNGGGNTASVSIAENIQAVTTVTATDPDVGQTLSYSIIGGADASKFTIGSSTGALSFVTAPNFELPTDVGGNNVYDVIVQASDGFGGIDTQAIAIKVTDDVFDNSQFNIVIRYHGVDPIYQAAFGAAVTRWTQIITADLADVFVSYHDPYFTGDPSYRINQTIDDLLIDATVVPIDGSGQVLGSAGPVLIRSSGSQLPVYGQMIFDSADIANMFANGTWTNVILHEMGHILGLGTMWDFFGLKNGAGDYIGSHALDEYRALTGNASASSIPVEHDFGTGTAGGHWDDETFNAELMTGFVELAGTGMPISRMTIGSLHDMGYTVSYSAADPYSLPGGPSGGISPSNDFNRDGYSDILWRHSSGTVAEWQMNGSQIADNLGVAWPGNEWKFQDTGDFGGDGMSDIMWRHDNGQVVLWQMNGNQIVSNTSILNVSNQYHVQGLADFGGDGKSDVLFRHDSGQVVLWQMNGDKIATNTAIATVSRDYHIEGVGDFGGDGRGDVLWRSDNGQVVMWQMNGDKIATNTAIGNVSYEYHVQGIGDFNGDGKSDVLWRHDSGQIVMWQMNGDKIVSNTQILNVSNEYQVQDVRDYNNDGMSDVLLRHDSGQVVLWEMYGDQIASNVAIGQIDNSWTIQSHHFDLL